MVVNNVKDLLFSASGVGAGAGAGAGAGTGAGTGAGAGACVLSETLEIQQNFTAPKGTFRIEKI